MKKRLVFILAVVVAVGMSSCKSKESAYKAAYEKAQEKPVAEVVEEEAAAPAPKPVVIVKRTSDASVKSEKVTTVAGSGLKAYSVIVGSFGIKTNATGLQEQLISKGFKALVVQNAQGMFRVVAASYDDKASAADERDNLRSKFPDAWLLYNN